MSVIPLSENAARFEELMQSFLKLSNLLFVERESINPNRSALEKYYIQRLKVVEELALLTGEIYPREVSKVIDNELRFIPQQLAWDSKEGDLVALLEDIQVEDAQILSRGDVGTIAYVYESGVRYEVEFVNAAGETLAVETLRANQLRKVDLRTAILHVTDSNLAA